MAETGLGCPVRRPTSAVNPQSEATEALTSTQTDVVNNISDAAASGGQLEVFDANAATGDSITYTVPSIPANGVSIRAGVKTYTSRGKFQLSIDGVVYGATQDQYSTAVTWPELHLGSLGTTGVITKNFKFDVKDEI